MTGPASVGLPWWHPAPLIATGLGVGHLPWVPGSWGSLAALACGWAIVSVGGHLALAIAAVVAFALGCWASGLVAETSGLKDPRFIVVDEIAAIYALVLLLMAEGVFGVRP